MIKEKRHIGLLISSVIFYALCAGILIYQALLLGYLIDNAATGNVSALVHNILLCLGSLIVYLLCAKIGIYFRMLYVKKRVVQIKVSMVWDILRMPLIAFFKNDHGYYLNLLTNDVDKIEEDHLRSLTIIAFNGCQLIFAVVALFIINWLLPIVFVVFFVIPMVIPQLLSKKLSRYQIENSNANEGFLSVMKDFIGGFETVKLNGAEEQFAETMGNATEVQQEATRRAKDLRTFITQLSNVSGSFSQVACFAFGGYLVIRGAVSIGDLIASIQLVNYCFQAVNVLGEKLSALKAVKPLWDKIAGLHSIEQIEKVTKKTDVSAECGNGVQYKNVSFSFGDKMILQDKTIHFAPGKAYAIIGPSGVGKSTFMKLMMKYYDGYEGDILCGTQNIQTIEDGVLYNGIKYVNQTPFLFNDTLLNNITLYRSYPNDLLQEVLQKTNLIQLTKEYANSNIGDAGNRISGGERQRISLARALLSQPKIIIFDEPTSALDPQNVQMIMDTILSMEKVTRIVITHDWDAILLSQFDEVIEMQ